jgi:hypothetical protein
MQFLRIVYKYTTKYMSLEYEFLCNLSRMETRKTLIK